MLTVSQSVQTAIRILIPKHKAIISHTGDIGLQLDVTIFAHLALHDADDLFGCLVVDHKHLNSLNEVFIMELHEIFNGLNLLDDVFSQELGQRRLLLSCSFV